MAIQAKANAVVKAGAGSGKTTVLAERYLHLIRDRRMRPSEILALTFTNKASQEMFQRIHRVLSESGDPSLLPILDGFGNEDISTLDAFCSRVARSASGAWALPRDFSIDDEALRDLAKSEALRFILERRQDPLIQSLLATHGLSALAEDVFAKVALRASPASPLDFGAMGATLEGHVTQETQRLLGLFEELREGLLRLDVDEEKELRRALRARAFDGPGGPEPGPLSELLCSINLIRSVKKQEKEIAKRLRDEVGLPLKDLSRAGQSLSDHRGLFALLAQFQGLIIQAKRHSGVLSYADVADMALVALRDQAGLRSFYKSRYRQIMIDEFQDDNLLQKELLYLLAEEPDHSGPGIPSAQELCPDKLFFVGDDKQSIYRFRGADVSVFNRLSGELGGGGEEIRLARNYRSEPRLIDFFNILFARVFGQGQADYEASFAPILSREPTPGLSPRVICASYLSPSAKAGQADGEGEAPDGDEWGEAAGEELLSPKECESWGIARFIADSVEGGGNPLMVREGQGLRPARHSDIAILQRQLGNQYILERFLRLEGIAYQSQEASGIFLEAPLNDFFAALSLAADPGDGYSLAVYLRSPLAKLSDPALIEALEGKAPGDPAERVKYERAMASLAGLRAICGQYRLSRMVSYLWYEAGYRQSILSRPALHPYLEHYNSIYSLAARADRDGQSLPSFLSELEASLGTPERLKGLEVLREEEAGVRLLTVHASKGLEFPIVIISGMEQGGADQESRAALYWWRSAIPTLRMRYGDEKSNPFLRAAKEADQEREAAELKRLFYVACTRAECHLYFSWVDNGRADNKVRQFRSLLAEGLSPEALDMVELREYPAIERREFLSRLSSAGGGAASTPPIAAGARLRAALAGSDTVPYQRRRSEFSVSELNALSASRLGPEALRAIAEDPGLDGGPVQNLGAPSSGSEEGGPAADPLPASSRAMLRGSLAHEYILAALGTRAQTEGGIPSARMRAELAAIDEGEARLLEAEAQAAAQGFLGSPLCARARAAQRRECEYPFLLRRQGPQGPYFARGVVDLFFVESGRCVVVDYKTGHRPPPGTYDLQLALYREALAQILGLGPDAIESQLFYLDLAEAEIRSSAPIIDDNALAVLSYGPDSG